MPPDPVSRSTIIEPSGEECGHNNREEPLHGRRLGRAVMDP
jgi:hypothetical protein